MNVLHTFQEYGSIFMQFGVKFSSIFSSSTLAHYLQYSNQLETELEIAVKSIENQLKVHSEALALRSQRNEILASNIANSATPNFKAKDLDFKELLNSRMGFGTVRTSDVRHFDTSIGPNEEE